MLTLPPSSRCLGAPSVARHRRIRARVCAWIATIAACGDGGDLPRILLYSHDVVVVHHFQSHPTFVNTREAFGTLCHNKTKCIFVSDVKNTQRMSKRFKRCKYDAIKCWDRTYRPIGRLSQRVLASIRTLFQISSLVD